MQIVIDIDVRAYNKCLKLVDDNDGGILGMHLINAIANGTPLPKRHGRLIEADRLRSMYSINRANFNTVVGIQKWIDDAPTIIEADKESAK